MIEGYQPDYWHWWILGLALILMGVTVALFEQRPSFASR